MRVTSRTTLLLGMCVLVCVGLSLWGAVGTPTAARAQTMPPWEAAEQLRHALFAAQTALIVEDAAAAQQHVATAEEVFGATLANALQADAPAAHAAGLAGLEAAQEAVQRADAPALALARGQTWGALLLASYRITVQAVEDNRPEAAHAWLLLREFRPSTRFSRPGADATLAIEALRAGAITPEQAATALRADLLDTYQALLGAELEQAREALARDLPLRQAEAVGLVWGYWQILEPAYAEQTGEAARQRAGAILERLVAAVRNDDAAGFAAAADELAGIVRSFRAAPLTAEEQARRAGQLLRFLSLVSVEYGRGVRNGQVVLDIEIQEAVTFLDGAQAAFEDLRLPLVERDSAQTAQVETLLQRLDTNIDNASRRIAVVEPDVIEADVTAAVDLLQEVFPPEWQRTNADADFDVIAPALDLVEEAVRAGQYPQAETARLEAYAIFDTGPEPRLLAFAPELVARIDGLFWQGYDGQVGLAQAIANRASLAEIQATRAALDEALADAQRVLGDGPGAPAAIIGNAAVIVFREGLEAVVILASLMASLVGAYRHYRRPMIIGAVAAFAATVITWWVAQQVLLSLNRFGERLEAVVSIIAIGVLLLITNWFFHNVYWTNWIARFHGQKRRLIGGAAGQFMGLALLGFTSIYREGFETVLFLQALVLDAGAPIVLQGVVLGLLATAAVGFVTFALQTKLPYKKMLIVTGILIGGVLLTMVGHTVHVMQIVGWMPISPIRGLDIPYWMGLWFGLFPTWECMIGQAAAALFVIGSYYLAEYTHKRSRRTAVRRAEAGQGVPEGS